MAGGLAPADLMQPGGAGERPLARRAGEIAAQADTVRRMRIDMQGERHTVAPQGAAVEEGIFDRNGLVIGKFSLDRCGGVVGALLLDGILRVGVLVDFVDLLEMKNGVRKSS